MFNNFIFFFLLVASFTFSGCASKGEQVPNKAETLKFDEDIEDQEVVSEILVAYLKDKGLYEKQIEVPNQEELSTSPTFKVKENTRLATPKKALDYIKENKNLNYVVLDMDLFSLLHLTEMILYESEVDIEEYKYKIFLALNEEANKFDNLDKNTFLLDFRDIDLEKIKGMKKEAKRLIQKARYEY